AAYAEWKGRKLPTVHQWERAARHPATSALASAFPWGFVGEGVDATERANFIGKGTMPVDSMPFGASPWGAHHMAGNVSEWCRNELPPGRAARGGAWSDAIYAFGQTAGYPAFYSAPTLGFRCVTGASGDEGDFPLTPEGYVPTYEPAGDAAFEELRRRYDYRRDPLTARVIERVETPDWTREKIEYTVAGKNVPAYLYLPKRFQRPLQVIHFAPAGDVAGGWRTLPSSIESRLAPLIRGGRAIFAVELEGFLGRPRPRGWVLPDAALDEYVDFNVSRVTEMLRGLDYLETRRDIDRARIVFAGSSAGGGTGVFVTSLDSRYRAVFFAGTGISRREERIARAASRIHFVPRIKGPTLMLHGRYDEDTSLKSEAEPMFHLLPEPKRLETFEGGHVPPLEVMIPAITKWFDETVGPVQH
ncbi:MAG TPA: SUMF1/EgtB/PvdO family nonheme iron enzyme, partial [Thermoanaerobaculia bacterium]|nr:SUMF1/EgtB/PvdO family nonheme iron enzyme [Thermoanaerobaculia bacterium]